MPIIIAVITLHLSCFIILVIIAIHKEIWTKWSNFLFFWFFLFWFDELWPVLIVSTIFLGYLAYYILSADGSARARKWRRMLNVVAEAEKVLKNEKLTNGKLVALKISMRRWEEVNEEVDVAHRKIQLESESVKKLERLLVVAETRANDPDEEDHAANYAEMKDQLSDLRDTLEQSVEHLKGLEERKLHELERLVDCFHKAVADAKRLEEYDAFMKEVKELHKELAKTAK